MNDLSKLILVFLQIGAFTFGGGYAMLSMIQQEVIANKWLLPSELYDFLVLSESTPGSFSVNIATYVGNKVNGISGALLATLAVVLPSFILILAISKTYNRFCNNPLIKKGLRGIRPCVISLIFSSAVSVLLSIFPNFSFTKKEFLSLFICLICFYLIEKEKKSPIYIIVTSALLAIIGSYFI